MSNCVKLLAVKCSFPVLTQANLLLCISSEQCNTGRGWTHQFQKCSCSRQARTWDGCIHHLREPEQKACGRRHVPSYRLSSIQRCEEDCHAMGPPWCRQQPPPHRVSSVMKQWRGEPLQTMCQSCSPNTVPGMHARSSQYRQGGIEKPKHAQYGDSMIPARQVKTSGIHRFTDRFCIQEIILNSCQFSTWALLFESGLEPVRFFLSYRIYKLPSVFNWYSLLKCILQRAATVQARIYLLIACY